MKGANDANYYFTNGTVTACDDSIPDYYFKANEIKRTGSFVVARPAILYIGDVPVMWLPFLFQDIRSGRRSGIIAPNVGVSDIVRNSPSYRRDVEGIGYYFAISDFLDSQVSLDWRSNAGEQVLGDAGFVRYNGEMRYHWLERYVNGNLALSHTTRAGGDQHGDQLGPSGSLYAQQLAHHELQLRHEHATPDANDGQPVRAARDHRVAGELPAEVRAGADEPGCVAAAISRAHAVRPQLPHAEHHHRAAEPRQRAHVDAEHQLRRDTVHGHRPADPARPAAPAGQDPRPARIRCSAIR